MPPIGYRADPRWNDPTKVPLSNGPFRAVPTAAEGVSQMAEDCRIVEFLLPYPMHIVGAEEWPALPCVIAGREAYIEAPRSLVPRWAPDCRIGNESPDVFGTAVDVRFVRHPSADYPAPGAAWPTVEQLLRWMRVKARHYWLLAGSVGFAAAFRGSMLTQVKGRSTLENFGSYGRNVIVRPLTKDLWQSLADELKNKQEPPVSESIFCDAIVSLVGGDEHRSVLELGVACEIDLTLLLETVSKVDTETSEKKQEFLKLRTKRKPSFHHKLKHWPKRLDLLDPDGFPDKRSSSAWINTVLELYERRGSVAHSGHFPDPKRIGRYLMAANTFLRYSRAARLQAGIAAYSFPNGHQPYEQIVAFLDMYI